MTREQQQAQDKRYEDWREVYRYEVIQRVKHWGDKRKRGNASPRPLHGQLDGSLFEPGR